MSVPPPIAETQRRGAGLHTARTSERETAMATELKASLAREAELLRVRDELLERQKLLADEFEHRLINNLQVITSLLSLQSRTAKTAEASEQLMIAAKRVASLGRVHRRLHVVDHRARVDIKRYIEGLRDDLVGLLFNDEPDRAIVVTGTEIELPTALGIPLGFIVNELITNAVKYASGSIAVHITTTGAGCELSVSDEGPGLPGNFDPAKSKGLGMKIIQSLVTQIDGTIRFSNCEDCSGARATVAFSPA